VLDKTGNLSVSFPVQIICRIVSYRMSPTLLLVALFFEGAYKATQMN